MGLQLGQVPQDGTEGRPLGGRVAQALLDEGSQVLAGRLRQAVLFLIETLFLQKNIGKKNMNFRVSSPRNTCGENGDGGTSAGVRSLRGTSASKQISSSVVPKLHLSAAGWRLPTS